MLCFVVVMQSFIMNSHEVFIHIHQGCFAGIGAIVRLPQCQWSKPDGYGKISQCITTTKHIKTKTVCIFLAIYCILHDIFDVYDLKDSVYDPTCSEGKIRLCWMCFCRTNQTVSAILCSWIQQAPYDIFDQEEFTSNVPFHVSEILMMLRITHGSSNIYSRLSSIYKHFKDKRNPSARQNMCVVDMIREINKILC